MELQVLSVPKVTQVRLDPQELRDYKVLRVLKELKELRVHKVHKGHKGFRVQEELKERWDQQEP